MIRNVIMYDLERVLRERIFIEKNNIQNDFVLILDMGLKLKIVPHSWEYTGFWKFGPYWPQK